MAIYTMEQVDCTVYTFAFFSHALQIFGVCITSVCVFLSLSLSAYCAPPKKGLLSLVIVFHLEKY